MNSRDITLPHLGACLIHAGLIEKQLAHDCAKQAEMHAMSFVSYLVQKNILDSQTLLQTCQKIFSLPVVDLNDYETFPSDIVNAEWIRQYRIIPLWKNNGVLHVGLSDPTNQEAIDAIAFHTQLSVKIFLVDETQFSTAIDHFYSQNEAHNDLQKNLIKQITLDETRDHSPDKIILYDEPLIQFVDNIILHGFQQTVSDIHIESHETNCRIRYRQHGILFSASEIPPALASRIITRLKVMANLNIAEKRLPQDGRFKLDTIDIRISTCPTLFGEKVVLRLLNSNQTPLDLTQLGLTEEQQTVFEKAISRPQGMVLVTGPTGSGKTVTLYSALNYLNTSEKNISTAEEPVEIRLPGINQVNINPKIGLTFSTALRAFLRQDPDIIMVGEIRDPETAEIAIQASRTGHLVLSTFHSNSAIETLTRMRAIGIPSHHIAESLSLVIASRLIRKLCDACKRPDNPSIDIPDTLYRANGCNQCTKGYKNRIAIYECLPVTEKINQLILKEVDTQSFFSEARESGFITMREVAMQQVFNGITSLAEVNRVLPP